MGVNERRTSWTAAELVAADLPAPRWAVEELFPEGLAFMCGAPKLGKSWFALALGIALAAGGHALGKIKVERGEVLYLALEDNPRRLQSRLRMLLRGDPAPDGLYVETEWERFDNGGLDRLEAWLNDHPAARLVLIDVWSRVRPSSNENGNRYQSDYESAAALQAVAMRHGVAVVALYHTRKAEAADFVETVQGTFGTAGAADTILVVKRSRGEADATLHVTGRDVAEAELAIRFSPESGAWELLGDAAEYGLSKTRKAILDTLDAHGPLTPKQVSELAPGVSHDLAKKTMQRMFADGQLSATNGVYTPVSAVPEFPPDSPTETGTEGLEGQGFSGIGDEVERLAALAREYGA
jgi:AAA domain